MRRLDPRVCSIGTMGKGERVLAGTTEAVLFEHVGQGCLTHVNRERNRFSAYRFHDEDPVVFQNGLRLTCRCGETEHGQAGRGERLPGSAENPLLDVHMGLSVVAPVRMP